MDVFALGELVKVEGGIDAGVGEFFGLRAGGRAEMARAVAADARAAGMGRGGCGGAARTSCRALAADDKDDGEQGDDDVDLALVFGTQWHGHGYCPPCRWQAGGGAGVSSPGFRSGRQAAGSASAGRSQVETRRRRLTWPPCCPVRAMARMTKKVWSRSRLLTKRMICGIFAADAGIHGDFSEVGAGLALGVLDAGEADAGCDLEIADARGDGGIVGRDALQEEGLHLGRGSVDTLVEAAQGSGLKVEGLQLDLLAGQGVGGAAVGGGPVQTKADGKGDDENKQNGKAGIVPGERRA